MHPFNKTCHIWILAKVKHITMSTWSRTKTVDVQYSCKRKSDTTHWCSYTSIFCGQVELCLPALIIAAKKHHTICHKVSVHYKSTLSSLISLSTVYQLPFYYWAGKHPPLSLLNEQQNLFAQVPTSHTINQTEHLE